MSLEGSAPADLGLARGGMAQRIFALGCAGAGKTTLARQLGERTGRPVICLDAIWRPDWGPDEVERFRAIMAEAHAGEAWISDGNFALATFDTRLARADLVVWLDRPSLACAWRAIGRVFRPGEAHRLADLPKVLGFIRNFDRINRPRIEAARLEHGPGVPVVHLRNDREIGAFVAQVS
jgi:adenylate kinase family enzyme